MNPCALRFAAATAAVLALAACGDGTGLKPGKVSLSLSGPVPARAARFRVVGPQTGVTAGGANVRVFSTALGGDTTMVAVIANTGHALSESNVATLTVPDVGAASSYAITLFEVAATNYTLLSASSFVLTIH